MPLKTTGQLRSFLLKAIDDVANGSLEPGRAHAITKLAAQISQSMMSEIEVARIALKDNRAVPKFGELDIGGDCPGVPRPMIEATAAPRLRGTPLPYPGDPDMSRSALGQRPS